MAKDTRKRDLEDVNRMLHLAKLKENDVLATSQTIYFTPTNLYSHSYKFLELDQHLHEVLKVGSTLSFKGDDDENVVLCTATRTYDVTGAETSNSLLLVNDLKFFDDLKEETNKSFVEVDIHGVFYDYLSVTPSRPHLKKLKDLLNKSLFRGSEHEYEVKKEDLFTFEELCETIQASNEELKEVLKDFDVVTINGKIRLLEFEFHFRALSYMLKLIDENSWNLDEVDYDETLNSLRDILPEEVLNSLFEKYTVASKIFDCQQLYSYKEDLVCRFFAQILLYGAGKFNLDDFLEAWKESVPEGMVPKEELLYGIAIIDRKSNPSILKAFSEDNLPEDINLRFERLFYEKEKWTVPEITPYIRRLATPRMDVNAMLAKYTRSSTVQGVKYYSAKHAK